MYRQSQGGGIGAKITGMVAQILMDVWMDLVSKSLEENDVIVYPMAKYANDKNVATSLIPSDYGWIKDGCKWKLRWSATQETEDSGKSNEIATMKKLRWLGDRIVPGLKLTQHLLENHT